MRLLLAALLLAPACMLPASEVLEKMFPPEGRFDDGFVTTTSFGIGMRGLSDNSWEGLSELFALSFDYSTRKAHWPVAVTLGLHAALGQVEDNVGVDHNAQIIDFSAGVRHGTGVMESKIELFYEAGAQFSAVSFDTGPLSGSDIAIGGYLKVAGDWVISDRWTVGLSGRYQFSTEVDVDVAPEEADVSGYTALFNMGARF